MQAYFAITLCSYCIIFRRRQYDPVIIERTIGLVLGPSTALYEPFLKHCTLTNKAVGTIWRALSKPPQRRQGPDLCPLWLLVGTPSANIPELAFSRAEHSRPYSDVAKYIFDIYRIWNEFSFHTVFMKRVVRFISPSLWRGDIKRTTSFINTVWNENSC